jgi:CheY-like chemotaxis protein
MDIHQRITAPASDLRRWNNHAVRRFRHTHMCTSELDMSDDRGTAHGTGPGRDVKATRSERRVPHDLKGRGNPGIGAQGHYCSVELPSKRSNSISEPDPAPLDTSPDRRSLGTIGAAGLITCRILVVEDDFLLAAGTERALRDAEATVLGPVGHVDQALALIATEAPTCALLDINLGEGTQFIVADALRVSGIPFMFVTGYDDVMIPERFVDIGRMRKPVGFRLVLHAAAQMCQSRS